nr:reverse transcriptase domain-containing protein [Tanacetum cinerariifolium]
MGVRNVHVSVDSKLVANQVLGTYVAKEENMVKYLEKAKILISGFANFSISQILRRKSIQEEEVATVVEEEGPTWMTPIMEYLKDGTLPGDRKEASKLCIKARQYELLEGVLYRRSFLKPWLRCVGPLQADYVISKIHEGSCSMHARPHSVVAKVIRLSRCGLFHKVDRSESRGNNHRHSVKKFMWDKIVCCYGLPREIVSKQRNEASHAIDGGKLGPKWEGPYGVTETLGDGAYRLRSINGVVLPRTWNVANLKKFYLLTTAWKNPYDN